MKNILTTLLLILVLPTYVHASTIVKHKKSGITLYANGNIKVDICHKNNRTINTNWNDWKNGHKRHGDTLGTCNKEEPSYILGERYNLVTRTNGSSGVDYDIMSDGSTNKYYYEEGSTLINKVINNIHGLQHEFVYYVNGNMQYDISHVTFLNESDGRYIESNNEDGKPDYLIRQDNKGNILTNTFIYDIAGNQVDYLRNQKSTSEEVRLYNSYFGR